MVRIPELKAVIAPLPREPLQNTIYRRICDLILEGDIVAGESMTVASLASLFGVSPMPVREALTRLVAAGALVATSGRTLGVPPLRQGHLCDIRLVRLQLEPLAAGEAAARTDPAFVEDLRQMLTTLEVREKAGNTKRYVKENYNFHMRVYRQMQSPIMLAILESLWLQVSPYLHLLCESENFRLSNRFHKRLFNALATGNREQAAEATRNDIDEAYESLGLLMKDKPT